MNLDHFISLIKEGEVVAFPTETVYGLGADAWNSTAIKKIYSTKGRPSDNPLIVHVSSAQQVSQFVDDIPEIAHKVIEAFWPGPISIVLPKKPEVLDAVTAGLPTVALRMPNHPLALEFISNTGPLVAPSANTSGKPSPTKASHVSSDFGPTFPVIDGEATEIGLESTVLDMTGTVPSILRPGSISKKQLEESLGIEIQESFFNDHPTPKSPGQKYSHYKPKATVRWMDNQESLLESKTLYLMLDAYQGKEHVISYDGNLSLLAKELYDQFRRADYEGFSTVAIQRFDHVESPLKTALLNRIEKAII